MRARTLVRDRYLWRDAVLRLWEIESIAMPR